MNIGIISAMNEEIQCFQKIFKNVIEQKIKKYQIYIGKYKNKNIILITSGIGKVSASIATTLLIHIYKVKLIINCGSAGSLNKFFKIGTIIVPDKTCYYDVNLTNFGYDTGQIPNYPKYFKMNTTLYHLINKISIYYKIIFVNGLLISGDTFIRHNKSIKNLQKKFSSAIAVDMESAAISQVCYQFSIPLVIIKSISDLSDGNATNNFNNNIYDISNNYFKIIKLMLNKKIYNIFNKI